MPSVRVRLSIILIIHTSALSPSSMRTQRCSGPQANFNLRPVNAFWYDRMPTGTFWYLLVLGAVSPFQNSQVFAPSKAFRDRVLTNGSDLQRYIDKLKTLLSQSGERESSPAFGELNHLVNTRVSAMSAMRAGPGVSNAHSGLSSDTGLCRLVKR